MPIAPVPFEVPLPFAWHKFALMHPKMMHLQQHYPVVLAPAVLFPVEAMESVNVPVSIFPMAWYMMVFGLPSVHQFHEVCPMLVVPAMMSPIEGREAMHVPFS